MNLIGLSHVCIYLIFVPFRLNGNKFARTFFVPSGKAGTRLAQPESGLKLDNFYHIKPPFRFAGTILR